MTAKYKGGSWSGVSSSFSPIQGPSSHKRMADQAKDQQDKDMDQLRSMKDVMSLQTQQMQASSNAQGRVSRYEMEALGKFSKTFNSFLNDTVKDEFMKRTEADVRKHMDHYRRQDAEYTLNKEDLQKQLTDAEKNKGDTAGIQKKLANLEKGRTTTMSTLKGNEKFAFYALRAENTVNAAPIGLQEYYNNNPELEVEQKYLSKDEKTGYPKIKIKDITDPRDKAAVAKLYQTQILKDANNPEHPSYLGGLKIQHQVALLHGPLETALNAETADDVKNYNISVAKERIRSNLQTLDNILNGRTGAPSIEGFMESIYPQLNRDMEFTGDTGSVWEKVSTEFSNAITRSTTTAQNEKIFANIKKVFKTKFKINGKTQTLDKHYPNRFNLQKLTKEYSQKQLELHNARKNEVKANVIGEAGKLKVQIKAKISKNDDGNGGTYTINDGVAEYENKLLELEKKDGTGFSKETLVELRGDVELTTTSEEWIERARSSGKNNHNEILLSEVAGMPKHIRDRLEIEGYNFVETYTGAATEDQTNTTKNNLATLDSLITASEKAVGDRGGLKNAGLSVAARDMEGDTYRQRLQFYMSEAGGNYKHDTAASKALSDVSIMIRTGMQDPDAEVTLGDDTTVKNPFSATRGRGGAWGKNGFVQEHNTAPRNLTLHETTNEANMLDEFDRNRDNSNISNKDELSKTWLWGDVDSKDPDTYNFLSLVDGAPSNILRFKAGRLGIPPHEYRNRQLKILEQKANAGDEEAQKVLNILIPPPPEEKKE